MSQYSVGGRGVVTAATANLVGAELWNPHASISLYVTAVWVAQTAGTVNNPYLKRSSARGATPNNTVTPTIENDWDRLQAPPSGALLDMGTFGTAPTLVGTPLAAANAPAAAGSGYMLPFVPGRGIRVPAGMGLCVYTPVAVALQPMDVTFFWDE